MRTGIVAIAAAIALAATAFAKESVFFIGAHPDDLEACMGLALRMKDDYTVRVIDFTRGEGGCGEAGFRDGTTAVKRVAEEREICKDFGTEPEFLCQINFQGRLAYADAQVTAQIVSLLLKHRPCAVFTHWPVDVHPDHVQCSAAVQHAVSIAARDHSFRTELYFYPEPPWQTKNFRATYYVDVTGVLDRSLELIGKYKCQNGTRIAEKKRKRLVEQGGQAPRKVEFAEMYTTFDGEPLPGGVLERFAVK